MMGYIFMMNLLFPLKVTMLILIVVSPLSLIVTCISVSVVSEA